MKIKKGYECFSCGLKSDLRKDWIIKEDDIKCKKCGSYNIYPMDINKGVILK
jgi:DNA-directed RNA polymerase subunit RPC12/RpoP